MECQGSHFIIKCIRIEVFIMKCVPTTRDIEEPAFLCITTRVLIGCSLAFCLFQIELRIAGKKLRLSITGIKIAFRR